VITLGISLFVLGFAVGPLVWAPLSEIFGRQIVFIVSFGGFTAFNAGAAGAQNIQTLLVLRFFAGAFGSSPFTNAGGVIADMFCPSQRGQVMGLFAMAPFLGPTLGPIAGGFLSENQGWRWVEGMMTIFSGLLWILGACFVPETYGPVLLRKRSHALSKLSGKVYKTQYEIDTGELSSGRVFATALSRPWILLFLEPIVLLLSVYMAIIYGTLYLLFGAFPIVFQAHRGWSEGIGGLAFLGVAIGMISAVAVIPMGNKRYMHAVHKHGGFAPPEARLGGALIGSVAIPVGLFWFAWTNSPSIHWMSPIAAGAPFGFGMILVFLAVTNYLIDAYTIFAASALAASSVLRSLLGAAFPLFTTYMFDNLGIHWASSIPAFLALGCIPFTFVIYKYGAAVRARSAYASEAERAVVRLQAQTLPDTENEAPGTLTPEEEMGECVEPSRTRRSTKTRTGSISVAVGYEGSPYDIDRVNTNHSVSGLSAKHVQVDV
jgi:multidrug resistance protein